MRRRSFREAFQKRRALLKPVPAEKMQAVAVSRTANSVKNDNEACIEPIGEPALEA